MTSGSTTLPAPRTTAAILTRVPWAVLVVDPETGEVLAADGRLAAGGLPGTVEAFFSQIGLREPDGRQELLAHVREGSYRTGRVVRVDDPEPPQDHDGPPGLPLYAGCFPMDGADSPWAGAVCVLLLPLGDARRGWSLLGDPDSQAEGASHWVRGHVDDADVLAAVDLSLSLSAAEVDDQPLLWVSQGFERLTGYRREEVQGRNCRFLQGSGTDDDAVRRIGDALRAGEDSHEVLLNFSKQGNAFYNELTLTTLVDREGGRSTVLGIQLDVTGRVLATESSEDVRARLSEVNRRLEIVLGVSDALSQHLDPRDALAALPDLLVPDLAPFAAVHLIDPGSGEVRVLATAGTDGVAADRLDASQPPLLDPLQRVLRGERTVRLQRTELPEDVLLIGLQARDRVVGCMSVAREAEQGDLTDADVALLEDMGTRAALAIDNARLFAQQSDQARRLQMSLLPADLPAVDGLQLASRYLPSTDGAYIGGDWYDVLELPDGSVGLAVGDVMGHDVDAAASMGQLRSVLRSYAYEGGAPSQVLLGLDRLVQALDMAHLATAFFARLERSDGWGLLRYSSAGHLPGLLVQPDGQVLALDGGQGLVIGVAEGYARSDAAAPVVPGSLLLLYTDGLVERRDTDIDESIRGLARRLREHAHLDDLDKLLDELTRDVADHRQDDVAVLVARVVEPHHPGADPATRSRSPQGATLVELDLDDDG